MQKGQAPVLILVGILIIMVIAGGTYFLGKSANPKPSPTSVVTSQTPQPTSTPSSESTGETANWKTYTNTKIGFEFNYPFILNKEDTETTAFFIDKDVKCPEVAQGGCLNQFAVGISTEEDFEKIYALTDGTWINGYTPMEALVKVKNLTVGGQRATQYKLEATNVETLVTLVKYKNVFIGITAHFGILDKKYDDRFRPLYDQILSTFKFIP